MKRLSDEDSEFFLSIAGVLALANQSPLFDGKPIEAVSASTDLSAMSIEPGELEAGLWEGLCKEAGKSTYLLESAKNLYLNHLKKTPFHGLLTDLEGARWTALSAALQSVWGKDESNSQSKQVAGVAGAVVAGIGAAITANILGKT